MKLDWIVQKGGRDDVTFERGLYQWVKISWYKVQHEQRHRDLNELYIQRMDGT